MAGDDPVAFRTDARTSRLPAFIVVPSDFSLPRPTKARLADTV